MEALEAVLDSLNDYMWRGQQHRHSGNDGEDREDDEAKSVDNHGSKFPVVYHLHLLVVFLHSVRDELQLPQNGL